MCNIFSQSNLLYQSRIDDDALRAFMLYTRRCHVKYHVEHELSTFDKLICSILEHEPECSMPLSVLGYKLGFDIKDNPEQGLYYDEAEENIFKYIIDEPCQWGLIAIQDGNVLLTKLGQYSLNKVKKYAFYSVDVDVLDWKSLNLSNGDKVSLYPFQRELGITAKFIDTTKLSYEDSFVSLLETEMVEELSQTIQLQAPSEFTIIESEYSNKPLLGIVPIKLDVELFQYDGHYSLSFSNDGKVCSELTDLYNLPTNIEEKDRKVEFALYTKLLRDENAVLNYQTLSPFEDIIELDKMIPDSRVDWHDLDLLQLIANNCTADDWRLLSKNCDINVLEQNVDNYKDVLDWGVLTLRLSEQFIIDNYKKYVWEPQLLSKRTPITSHLIKFVLINYRFEDGKDDGQWNWEEIVPLLDFDFIKDNIANIPFDLSSFTYEIDDNKKALIASCPNATWNWRYITNVYPVEYNLENISVFAGFLNLGGLLDRLFVNPDYIKIALGSNALLSAIKENLNILKTIYSPNNKQYIWSDDSVDFFEKTSLLQWNSTQYTLGFVRNPSLIWDKYFFLKHHNKINSESDISYICSNITDNSVINLVPEFAWDWKALSRNIIVYNDYEFINKHVTLIDRTIVALNCSSELVEQYFELLGIDSMMNEELTIQAKATDCVSVEFIKMHINANWDWRNVTRKVYQTIKIELIGNSIWKDKWDWIFLSQNLDIDSILNYSAAYSDKWDWSIVLKRLDVNVLIENGKWNEIFTILLDEEKYENEWIYLSRILPVDYILSQDKYIQYWKWSVVFSNISEEYLLHEGLIEQVHTLLEKLDNTDSLWSILTKTIQTDNLLEVTKKYSEDSYRWDYSSLYSRPDFNAKKYLDDNLDIVKWDDLSASESVNKMFAKSSNKKTKSLWIRIFKDYLNNENYKWNYSKLSHLSNILQEPRLLQLEKEWDWNYISSSATWISFAKGENFYLISLSKRLNFILLSSRADINITENDIVNFENKGYKWDWDALTSNKSIVYSLKFIKEHIEKQWDWNAISNHPELDNEFVVTYKEKSWDWSLIIHRSFFLPTVDILKFITEQNAEIDWKAISTNNLLSEEVLEIYENEIDWSSFIRDNERLFKIIGDVVSFVNKYSIHIVWDELNDRINTDISNELVETCAEKIDWRNASRSQFLDFSTDFVRSYQNNWYWNELFNNLKFQNDIPAYKAIFKKQLKVNEFLKRLKREVDVPYIYHFTHLYNAIDVIKTKKILSRDRAKGVGLLRFDSAGSVVLRSSLAHPYARFYFRPCTPTQYYNEALGADSKLGEMGSGKPVYDEYTGEKYYPKVWKSKYPKALSLGLPKCPIPVFFRFDIEEVLSSIPELCYYSDMNMQSNNPHVYKIIDNVESLCTDYLYDTMSEAKIRAKSGGCYDETEIDNYMKYSQQEFLVKSEFDFSNIKSLKIICYDEQYTNLLRSIFHDDPICNKIYSVNELGCDELFEGENRSITLTTQVDSTTLSTDFQDDYYFIIKSENLASVRFDFSFAEVLYEKPSKELHVRGRIKWINNSCPFDVYFMDPKARTKEWLVYSNNNQSHSECKFKVEENVRNSINTFVDSAKALPILLSKELFFPHMVNSYHGIEHTVRVLFLTHLLCDILNLSDVEKTSCCIAAIIHDLGKRSDREGAEHGFNSSELYNDKMSELISDVLIKDRILQAVRFHSVEDKDCPNHVKQDIIWKVLKDADALDRSRFAGKGCDKSYLRLDIYQSPSGQNIFDLASYLPGWIQDIDKENIYEALSEQVNTYSNITK